MTKNKNNFINFQFFDSSFEYEKIYKDSQAPWSGHKFFIYDFVRNLKPKIIVELGTYKGTSIFSMTQAVKDNSLDTKLYAIDTWKGDKHGGFYDNSIFEQVKKIKNKYYSKQNLTLLRKTFNEAKLQFKNQSIDLLHIDGLHTYETVKNDFDNWIDKVKEDGIIIFHDISEKKADFGVYKFWDEIKTKYPSFEFDHSHGLGIIFRNKKIKIKYNIDQLLSNYYQITDKCQKLFFDKTYELKELKKTFNIINKQLKLENDLQKSNIENLNNQLKQLSLKNENLNNQIIQINNINKSLNNSLHIITSTKFYKLSEFYSKIKQTLFKKINRV